MRRPLLFFLFLFFAFAEPGAGQITTTQKDTSLVYRKIESYSSKRKFSKFLYGLFFKPVKATPPVPGKKKRKSIPKPYSAYEGKIIRQINITTLDPFGYSITDTASRNQNFFYRAGNNMHIKTQRLTIRNLLLIKKNEPFDSLLVSESERLIRSQKYVHEVSFRVEPLGIGTDSVDIYIRELDIWSIIPAVAITPGRFTLDLTDRNFLGLGHEFQGADSWYHSIGSNAFFSSYTIPNIRNSYINARVHYETDEYKNFGRSVAVERPFFSPVAKWAAGLILSQNYKKDSINFRQSGNVPFDVKFNLYDYWAGSARRIFKGNTADQRTTNLILSARFIQINYLQKPEPLYDSLRVFTNENFYLGAIGISTRNYVQDKYIFNYGNTEDVPIGKVYALTFGYQEKNSTGRLYLGARYSLGGYYRLGYISSNFEYGTFFRSSRPEQGVFSAGLNYFTGLFELGNWNIRQFVKSIVTYGIRRLPNEHLNINNENGIRGFNPSMLWGTNKFVLTLQTQTYCPWNILGFRFGPYIIYSMGMLGNADSGFKKSRVYSQFGFGLLIKNEYLVFNYFQVSVAFYPVIPETGDNIFKINPNSSTDFGFRNFEIGKPAPVLYQ